MVESEVTIDMEEESAETINEIAALETLLLTADTPVAAAIDTPVAATPVAAPVAATALTLLALKPLWLEYPLTL